MQKISDISISIGISGQEIGWNQPDWRKHEVEIRIGNQVVGTLSWETGFESLAIARSAEGVWTFKRGGISRPWIAVRAHGTEWDIARLAVDWNWNGVLAFHDGRQIQWEAANVWSAQWKWDWVDGTSLISIEADPRKDKNEGVIKIHQQAESVAEVSLLTLLGCYLVILRAVDIPAEALAG